MESFSQKPVRFEKSENKDMRNPYRVLYTGYTDRLCLRPFMKHDAKEYARLANDPIVQEKDFGIDLPFLREHAAKKVEYFIDAWNKGTCHAFAIRHEAKNVLLGGTSLMVYRAHGLGELGYWLGQEHWGQGFATEAAAALIQFGFDVLKLDKISSQTLSSNQASAQVLQKVGMQQEGILRKHWVKEGNRVDLVQFGILKD